MLEIERIFFNKKVNTEKLVKEYFIENKGTFTRIYDLENEEFHVEISIKNDVKVRLYEKETGEEYTLIHAKSADGFFVNSLREEVKRVLEKVATSCYEDKGLDNKILKHVKERYGVEPEYLFEKHPDFAVLKTKEKKKWFGLVMMIEKETLGLKGKGKVLAINLKAKPEEIVEKIDGKNYLPAYHMNKKHWLTLVINEKLAEKILHQMIEDSYKLVEKKQ